MFFTKYPHPSNFSFATHYDQASSTITAGDRRFEVGITGYEGGITHIRVCNPAVWGENKALVTLDPPEKAPNHRTKVDRGFGLSFTGMTGQPLLRGVFGVSGEAAIFVLDVPEVTRFYGMGEKSFGRLELSGLRTKFWNTDVWGDFHAAQFAEHPADPSYLSLPYVIVQIGDEYLGFLLHNPYPTFMETPGKADALDSVEIARPSSKLILGSEGGEPNLWVLYGPSLRQLTRKFQKLVGVTPLPPAWALGYHQSRWGYGGHDDLIELDRRFAEHKIPCDSLWLDLDYMDGCRVFTTSKSMFPDGVAATVEALAENDRRIVPILDPGVKSEPGYSVYDDGHAKAMFCLNTEGREFVGLVWPGETVFPDFTRPEVREWWAGYVKAFAESGFGATWIDMNDPSTGPVDPTEMRFNSGADPHRAHHNQYALGMQMATRKGLLCARPEERPFLISRSGFVGSSRVAAIWTGDNLSNQFHLKASIPTSLGMSLSGLPFNGPDIGGFGGETTEALMIQWVKANFLFPFFRNHCAKSGRPQEPFAFPDSAMSIIRRYIRLRYKLFPYLYNLFIAQEEDGDPILRPLMYDFSDAPSEFEDNQFLVGPSILQAPFLEERKTREAYLPGSDAWFDAAHEDWTPSGRQVLKEGKASTPLFVRCGAIIPMQPGTPTDNRKESLDVHFHIFVLDDWSGEASYTYHADDGISYAYRSGGRSSIEIRLAGAVGNLALNFKRTAVGYGRIEPTFLIHCRPKSVRLNGATVKSSSATVVMTGKALRVEVVRPE